MFENSKFNDQNRTGQATRDGLIMAGLNLFGSKGFEATSTREIAALANANIASIAYHFGGKDGLRLACANTVIERLNGVVGQTILASDAKGDSEVALAMLETALTALANFIVTQHEARNIASFMMREVENPGIILDQICEGFIFPVHAKFCQLLAIAVGGDPHSSFIKLAVFTMVGQLLYFRIGHQVVLKRMAWKDIGPGEVEEILAVVLQNLRSFVATNKVSSS